MLMRMSPPARRVSRPPAGGVGVTAQLMLVSGTTGASTRYQVSFPLRPGDLTDADFMARKGALFVNGTEVAVHANAPRGRHNDGTLRAIVFQLDYTFADTTPITAQVQLGTVRSTSDLTQTTVTQSLLWDLGATPYQIRALLVPTDPAYLCETLVSGSPLIPATSVDAVSYPLLIAYADDRFESLKNSETTNTSAASDYEHVRGLTALWCMTADVEYLTQALSRARYLFTYSNDTTPSTYSPTYNLESITGGSGVNGNETKTQRHWTFYCGYYLTGWPSFWGTVDAGSQQAQRMGTSRTYAVPNNVASETSLSPRKTLAITPYVWIAALMDATRTVSSPSGSGVSGASHLTQMAKIWTDLAAKTFAETHGGTGWRTGFPFAHENYRDDDTSAAQGDWPWFQSALVARQMVDYYVMVQAHSDIPPYIQLMCNAVVAQCTTSNGGAARQGTDITSATMGGQSYTFDNPVYSVPYLTRPDPANNSTMNCWTFPMWNVAMAFMHAHFGGNAPDGTPWLTWYRRTVNPRLVWHNGANSSGLGWSWKIWGEICGGSMISPWLIANAGGAIGGPSTPRTPTVHTTWPT